MSSPPFHGSARPTLGVELELQLVDARSLALRPAMQELLARIPQGLRDSVKPEFHCCCVEINSGICRDVAEVGRDLAAKLRDVDRLARRIGLGLAWGGTHPFGHWREQPISPDPRYQRIASTYGETLCRQLTFGLHVHVGVPDGDAAARACDRLREELPALIALAANSPFWCGRPTGLMAHRVEVLGAGPSSGLPPRLGDWERYAALVGRLVYSGRCQGSGPAPRVSFRF
jgi:glutamate---cysteine ligase / carboxylate-amine ligase